MCWCGDGSAVRKCGCLRFRTTAKNTKILYTAIYGVVFFTNRPNPPPPLPALHTRYKVRYSEYGNEETVAWTRLKKLKSAEPPAPSSQPPVEPKMPTSPEQQQAASPPLAEDAPPPFAGMRPRAMCVENYSPKPKAQQASEGDGDGAAQAADVVNPVLLSAAPSGRKLSWKEKLAARKKAGGTGKGGGGGGAGGVSVHVLPKKEVSLVQDFAAQRKEQAVDRKMDKSEWRTKVAFGIGNAKRPA